jgi:hypothetical protein
VHQPLLLLPPLLALCSLSGSTSACLLVQSQHRHILLKLLEALLLLLLLMLSICWLRGCASAREPVLLLVLPLVLLPLLVLPGGPLCLGARLATCW